MMPPHSLLFQTLTPVQETRRVSGKLSPRLTLRMRRWSPFGWLLVLWVLVGHVALSHLVSPTEIPLVWEFRRVWRMGQPLGGSQLSLLLVLPPCLHPCALWTLHVYLAVLPGAGMGLECPLLLSFGLHLCLRLERGVIVALLLPPPLWVVWAVLFPLVPSSVTSRTRACWGTTWRSIWQQLLPVLTPGLQMSASVTSFCCGRLGMKTAPPSPCFPLGSLE